MQITVSFGPVVLIAKLEVSSCNTFCQLKSFCKNVQRISVSSFSRSIFCTVNILLCGPAPIGYLCNYNSVEPLLNCRKHISNVLCKDTVSDFWLSHNDSSSTTIKNLIAYSAISNILLNELSHPLFC